jgi:DNA repair protein SbcD/Mre11
MRIAHLADVHLGYRAYHRLGEGGVNQRERDVADALGRVLDQVIAEAPDLVVVAGDLFHTGRPSNDAIMEAFRQFTRLRRALPATPVVLIAGSHDSPRAADAASILRLLSEVPAVHVVDDGVRPVHLMSHDASVWCLPHSAVVDTGAARADGRAGTNVLVAHGLIDEPVLEPGAARRGGHGGPQIDRAALREEMWDYVALGGYHDAIRLAPNMWYAGATERTSPDVWAEAGAPRGWVLYDTDARAGELRAIELRPVVDLPVFSARAADAGAGKGDGAGAPAGEWVAPDVVDARIRAAVDSLDGGVARKVVRQVITDVPRELFRRLDHEQIRALKAEAVHYQLEARRPEPTRRTVAGARPRTLEEELAAFLADWEPGSPGIDRDRLLELGTAYLADPGADGGGSAP